MSLAVKEEGKSPNRFHGLDLLRSLAIASVLLWHLPRNVNPLSFRPATWAGVDLFFVLSGFLIGSQLLRPYSRGLRPSYTDFALRRAFRIFPAFLVVLGAYFLIPQFREEPSIRPFWRFITFTMNFRLNAATEGAFTHAWSLCVEEHFYLLLPLVVLWFMRKPSVARAWKISGVIVLGGLVLRGVLWTHFIGPLRESGSPGVDYLMDIYYPTYNRLDGLLAGVALASIRTFKPAIWARLLANGNAALGISLLVLGAALWICQDMFSLWTATLGYPLLALGFALLVVASLSSSCFIGRWRVPGSKLGATLAFSMYLTHKEVMHLDRLCLTGKVALEGLTGLAVYLASFLFVAGAIYLVVERPFLLLRDRLLGKNQRTRPLLF